MRNGAVLSRIDVLPRDGHPYYYGYEEAALPDDQPAVK